ncbi:GNAT family N-acetyltransferase [Evansella sp. AB-rgal1]|uniref:GNAT family N-acetyltransferase n=1 Tax=Evansella sp. AB-rgal1 TaxID=3242696 RepID=UPI00359E75E1
MVITSDFAKQIEQSEITMVTSRLQGIQRIPNNPMNVEIKKFGGATAFTVKNIPGPSYNTVKGLDSIDMNKIKDIIHFYHEKEIPCRFELTPAHSSPKLLAKLTELGYYQTDFHTTLAGPASNIQLKLPDKNITIRPLKENEFQLFAEIYVKSFQMPEFLTDGVAQNNKVLYSNPNWKFYIACVNEIPAAIGVLYITDDFATLAASATLPEFRNNGCHTALIHKRIIDATASHSKYIVGQARFGSVSQLNMERIGMKIAYTKAIWIQRS